ncbi:MAG: tetratricopeptide repeat protein, partial [Pseudomonadales bacterium]
AEAYNNMGLALEAMRDLEAAMGCYSSALKIKPDYADVYNNVGNILKKQSQPDKAIENYKIALNLESSHF